jgi:hypothetical protein
MNLQDILQNIEVPGLWWSRNGIPGILDLDMETLESDAKYGNNWFF